MTQTQRRLYLIRQLQKEQPEYMDIKIPLDEQGQKNLLRALFNLRMPKNAGQEFLDVQDAYLQEEIRRRVSGWAPCIWRKNMTMALCWCCRRII